MNLKELIKEVEFINNGRRTDYAIGKLKGIRKTVEAVENWLQGDYVIDGNSKKWATLKKLLGVK